jgi:hypothetical protein
VATRCSVDCTPTLVCTHGPKQCNQKIAVLYAYLYTNPSQTHPPGSTMAHYNKTCQVEERLILPPPHPPTQPLHNKCTTLPVHVLCTTPSAPHTAAHEAHRIPPVNDVIKPTSNNATTTYFTPWHQLPV